jgi:hypothetical protein
MKKNQLLFFILLLPVSAFCQSLTGLWMGSLTNDSSTVRRDQSFEMALTEYRGKVYGYSHTTFIVHDTLFYIVKRVKGTINGDLCEVKDDELISCNFMTKLDKGVKQVYTFHLNKSDSIWRLDGDWKTTKTKNYYSISGSVKTATEKDISKSKLFPHLQELNLTDAIASLQPPKKEPEPVKQPQNKEPVVAKAEPKKKTEQSPVKTEPTTVSPPPPVAKTNTDKEIQKEQTQPVTEPPVISQKEVVKSKPEVEKKKEDTPAKNTTTVAVSQPDLTKTNTGKAKQKEQTQSKTDPAIISQNETAKSKSEVEKKKEILPVAAVNVEKRKSEMIQTVDFKSDSLVLSLYDNGEIDGDTVSVLINGEVVMAQQGLKATAIKKTIYISPAMKDSFTMVLYAENLGKYPPNTGLIIVHDGEDVYQVRFSADLQKNVAVKFKRKKK